jgi:raffinose/stachyose/melibiose transport system permease protein
VTHMATRTGRIRKKRLTAAMFLAPALLVYLIYIVYPVWGTLKYSFYDWKGGPAKIFVGLSNYTGLLSDPMFWNALQNNGKVLLASVFIQIPLGLAMSLLLLSRLKGRRLMQTIFFLPYLMPTVAIGLLFSYIFDPLNGPVNRLLQLFGMETVAWLSDPRTALPAVLLVVVWQHAPFYMVLLKAAIVGISDELYEAAAIDGASAINRFRSITLPLILPTITISSILAIVGSLKAFDLFYIMSGGGLNQEMDLMGSYMYRNAFVTFKMGYGSAVAFVMFVLCFLVAAIIQYMEHHRRIREEGER